MQKLLGLAILSGLILSASFPSLGFPPLLFLGFIPLLFLEDELSLNNKKKQKRKLFGYVYLAFFIWNAISIWWLHYAKHPNGNYAWEAYFIAVAANAFLMTLIFILYGWVKKLTGDYLGSIFFVTLWISFEKLHLEWELTWPWFNLGNGFANYYKWIQWYEFTGVFGGTLWILTLNFILYHGIKEYRKSKQKKFLYRTFIISISIAILPIIFSYYIYQTYQEKGEKINITIIQPQLDPYTEKYTKPSTEITEELLGLAEKSITQDTDFIVCPETAFPGNGNISVTELGSDLSIIQIKNWLKKYPKINFISGVQLYKQYQVEEKLSNTASDYGNGYIDFYNSSIQLNNKESAAIYHKSKLVPGVEIFPYMNLLKPLLGNLMLNFGGTVSSLGKQEYRTPFINVYNKAIIAPLICYEAIYGEYTAQFTKNNANVLFMMSNDSWWDDSDGHKELFLFSRLRAIETRRSIVRSANSGISALINQRGDIIKKINYGVQGTINGQVQLNNKKTDYIEYGDYIARIAIFITGVLFAFALSQKILSKKS